MTATTRRPSRSEIAAAREYLVARDELAEAYVASGLAHALASQFATNLLDGRLARIGDRPPSLAAINAAGSSPL